MSQIRYKRILLKLSGEALAGGQHRGLDFDTIGRVCDVVGQCVAQGVQVAIVVGGGNFWRGLKDGSGRMERTRADHMGMLAPPSTLWLWRTAWSSGRSPFGSRLPLR